MPSTPQTQVEIRVGLPDDAAAQAAVGVVTRLREAGFGAYLVGGCVRDLVLGLRPKDWDVATAAEPAQVRDVFSSVIEVGVAFGVVRVPFKAGGERHEIEVATFRAESGYADGRRPDNVRFTDAREDVLRRDFTINGLLLQPDGDGRGTVVDFVGGVADLKAKVLRAIGDPAARFTEDYLRILRVVRFAARFEFAVDPATLAAAAAAVPSLVRISAERVRDELLKMLCHRTAPRSLELLGGLGVPALLWPDLAGDSALDGARVRFEAAFAALERTPSAAQDGLPVCTAMSPGLAVALLFGLERATEHRRTARRLGAALKLSGEDVRTAAAIARLAAALLDRGLTPVDRHRALREDAADAALILAGAAGRSAAHTAADRRERAALSRSLWWPEPWVTGETLRSRGHRPGPAFRDALLAAEASQLSGATPQEALAAAENELAGQ